MVDESPHPSTTQIAIALERTHRAERHIRQARELVKIRAFSDAAREMRTAAVDLHQWAAVLAPEDD